MNRIGIIGVGAIGGTLAISLHRAGHRPHLAVRRPFGHLVGRLGDVEVSFDALALWRSPAQASPVDVLFVATKAHQTVSASAWLSAASSPDTVVVVVQNGVEQETRVQRFVDGALVLPGIIDIPAGRRGPGEIDLRRRGRLSLPTGAAGERVAALFSADDPWLSVVTDAQLETVRWRKLCVNVISGAVPTLTDRPAAVFRDPAVRDLCRQLIAEVVLVAAAEGINLPSDVAETVIAGFVAAPPHTLNSMLRDRRAGRPLESDARHGAVVRIGRRHGLPTPYNHFAQVMLEAINPETTSS